MPSITPADAVICAADHLPDAIAGLIPTPTIAADAINQLMTIFKLQARANKDNAAAQRVLRERAQAEMVIQEEEQQRQAMQECQQEQASPSTVTLELEEESNDTPTPSHIPQITQEEYESPPAANTCQQQETRTLTQDFMLQCM